MDSRATGHVLRQMAQAAVVGAGATVVMDVGAELLRRTRGTRSLDYALVGRWVGHMPRGKVAHRSIREAEPVPSEKLIGWTAHYVIGTGIAVILVAARPAWLERPTLVPALVAGVGTVAAPWFLMQPAFGMGVAGSRTPDPAAVRIGSLRAHTLYGLGLWVCGRAARAVRR